MFLVPHFLPSCAYAPSASALHSSWWFSTCLPRSSLSGSSTQMCGRMLDVPMMHSGYGIIHWSLIKYISYSLMLQTEWERFWHWIWLKAIIQKIKFLFHLFFVDIEIFCSCQSTFRVSYVIWLANCHIALGYTTAVPAVPFGQSY